MISNTEKQPCKGFVEDPMAPGYCINCGDAVEAHHGQFDSKLACGACGNPLSLSPVKRLVCTNPQCSLHESGSEQ